MHTVSGEEASGAHEHVFGAFGDLVGVGGFAWHMPYGCARFFFKQHGRRGQTHAEIGPAVHLALIGPIVWVSKLPNS